MRTDRPGLVPGQQIDASRFVNAGGGMNQPRQSRPALVYTAGRMRQTTLLNQTVDPAASAAGVTRTSFDIQLP